MPGWVMSAVPRRPAEMQGLGEDDEAPDVAQVETHPEFIPKTISIAKKLEFSHSRSNGPIVASSAATTARTSRGRQRWLSMRNSTQPFRLPSARRANSTTQRFQRRVGFGRRPALINVDLANAWTRPGNPFTCEKIDEGDHSGRAGAAGRVPPQRPSRGACHDLLSGDRPRQRCHGHGALAPEDPG